MLNKEGNMSDHDHIGISKIARQKVIDRLKHSYAQDYLDQGDFEKRVSIALATQKRSELYALVDDVPEIEEKQVQAAGSGPERSGVSIAKGNVADSDKLICIFSGVTKKGAWHPPKYLRVISFMGGADLDFTNAYIPESGIEIKCFSFMGGTHIRVPAGVNVKTSGFAFMGGFDNRTSGEAYPGMPTIHIRGFAFMGGVEIKGPRKPGVIRKFIDKLTGD
jgi:hypothetical protein